LLWLIVAAAVVLILFVGYLVWPKHKTQNVATSTGQESTELMLRVQRNGGELLLTWNRDSDVVRKATHAVLSISDGEQHENVDMDPAQLRTGSIVYTPGTPDVVFSMEINGKPQGIVRALQSRPSPIPQTGQPQPASASAPAPAQPAAPKSNAAAEAPPQQVTAVDETPSKQPDRPLKPFNANSPSLSQRLRPAAQADLPDAPALGTVPAAGTTSSPLNLNPTAPPPPPPVAPAQPPATTSNSTPAPAPAAPKQAQTGGQIRQAELIRKKDPEYPKIARDAGAKGTVELLATIGPDGRVKTVKVIKGHPMLTKAASDAVMQWLYKPTMLNGVAVEGQVQVQVNFLGR
jgi:protein TonB